MLNRITAWMGRGLERLFGNEIIRRVTRNFGYLFSATGITAALSFFQNILAARLLGPAGLGVLGAITQYTSVLNKLVSFRMGELVVRYVGEYTEQGDQARAAAVFKLAALAEVTASLAAFGLAWLLAPLGARWFAKDASLAPVFVLYSLIILANLIAESSIGLLQIFDRYRRMAGLQIAQGLFTLALIALAYWLQGGLAAVAGAYLGGKALGALGFTAAALVEAGRRWGRRWWTQPISLLRPDAGGLARFAVSTNLSASLSLITKDSEMLWISLFRNPTEVGYYKQALALVNLVQLPISPLPQATYPELAREAARGAWDNLRYILRQGSILAGSFTLIASLGLIVFGRPIISLLYGPEFLPAYPALVILLFGFLVANTFYWNRTALLALNRPDIPTKINLFLAVFKIIGIFLLVPQYGFIASAFLLSASYLIGVGISVWRVRVEIRLREELAV
ncbi:MAG TPA: flippase [Anaerolineales bacterium]|nr:flippase [Anaerolineales bacterium]